MSRLLKASGMALTLISIPTLAWAHAAPVSSEILGFSQIEHAASTPEDAAFVLILAIVAGTGLLLRGRRRPVALGLVLLLGLLAFESGIHAVHHLGNPAEQGACTVAAATAHLTGELVEGVTLDRVAVDVESRVSVRVQAPVARHSPAPFASRAPPSPIA